MNTDEATAGPPDGVPALQEKGSEDRVTPARPRSVAPFLLVWLGVAVGMGFLLAFARAAEGPLDDRDPALQRPGFLDAGELPVPAPRVVRRPSPAGRPTVVFFVRTGGLRELCHSLATSELRRRTALAVVVAGSASTSCEAAGTVVPDRDGEVAEAFGLRRPRGGGPPVGYAVLDASGDIRYRTLDPEVADQLQEVATIVAALP